MAPRLVTWARNLRLGDDRAKHLLVLLADQAWANGICWPSLKTLADDSEMKMRTVQRKLSFLVGRGVVEVEDRRHARRGPRSNLYRLLADAEYLRESGGELTDVMTMARAHATVARAQTPKLGASPSARVARAHTPKLGARANAKGGVSYESPSLTTVSSEEEPERAREAPSEFARTFEAWTSRGVGGTSWEPALREWEDLAPTWGADRLEGAAQAYLAQSGDTRRHGPKALQYWLRDGDFRATIERASAAGANVGCATTVPARFASEEVRDLVVGRWGNEAAISYLDRSSWAEATRTVTAWSDHAFRWLDRDMAREFRHAGIAVARPDAGSR